jgi:aspartate ammonia-lyase
MDSMAMATALVPKLGYARVSKLARQSVAEGRPLLIILDESGLLAKDDTLVAIHKASHPVFDV